MNHHPHFPGTIPAFKELHKEDRKYFADWFNAEFANGFLSEEDSINLSDSDRLLFLSHFNAIGKMWDELSERFHKREEEFKTEKSISHIDTEDEYVKLDLLIDGEKRYVLTDTTGEIADTNIPHSEDDDDCCFPEVAIKVAHEYGRIWDELSFQMKTFCKCLGYTFEWDGEEFHLHGNGIKTSGYAWGNDNDSLFENLEALQ